MSGPILNSHQVAAKAWKRQRILFVSSSSGFSGAEVVLINLLRTMDKERFEVSVFCNVKNLLLVERLQNLAIEFKTSSRFPDPERIGKSGLAFSKVFAYTSSFFRVGTELISYLRKRPFDLIHANGYPDCLYCLLPAWMTGIPLTWHLHDMRPVHREECLGLSTGRKAERQDHCGLRGLPPEPLEIPDTLPPRSSPVYNGIDLRQFKEDPDGS